MANFFFISLDGCESINHAKISVKFDNYAHGKARISFRLTFKPTVRRDLILYLLIKNDENPVMLERIYSEYNEKLKIREFLQVAGAYELESVEDLDHCTIFNIGKFRENPDLQKKKAIHPKKITCTRIDYENTPEKLRNTLSRRDMLLRINVDHFSEVLEVASSIPEDEYFFMFQFRVFLEHFIPEKALECWRSSNKSWSVDFDIHKQRNYEDLINSLGQMGVLRYPESIELWFTIPQLHFFVASSPIYEKAFRLKSEDLAYKTEKQQVEDLAYKTEKQQVGEFETQEGDYAVKIVSSRSDFAEFSIICVSPFLPGEKPEDLKEEIKAFRAEAPGFVKWSQMISPLVLLLTLLALVFAIVSIFVTGMAGKLELRLTLWTITAAAIFFGLSVWGISTLFHLVFSNLFLRKKRYSFNLIAKSNVAIGIMIVIAILTFSVFYLLEKLSYFQ